MASNGNTLPSRKGVNGVIAQPLNRADEVDDVSGGLQCREHQKRSAKLTLLSYLKLFNPS